MNGESNIFISDYMDVKDTQAVEVTDILQKSVKSNNVSTISSTRMLPDVQFDMYSESSKEIESCLSNSSQEVNHKLLKNI